LEQLVRLTGSSQGVSRLDFSMDDTLLAAVNQGNTLSIWNVTERRQIARLGPLPATIRSLAFSHDKKLVAAGLSDGTVQVWRLAPAVPVQTFRGHRFSVEGVAFSPDGGSLVTASWDGNLKSWNLATGRPASLPRALMAYSCVAVSPDGQRIAAAGQDSVVRIIDATTGAEVASLPKNIRDFRGDVWTVRFSTDGNVLLALDRTGLTVWRATSIQEIAAAAKDGSRK